MALARMFARKSLILPSTPSDAPAGAQQRRKAGVVRALADECGVEQESIIEYEVRRARTMHCAVRPGFRRKMCRDWARLLLNLVSSHLPPPSRSPAGRAEI